MFTRARPQPALPEDPKKLAEEPPLKSIHELSYLELKAFHEHVGTVLAQRAAQARETFRSDFLGKMEEYGMSLDDFKPEPIKKERKKREAKPKYRNPNSGEEWSGRGKPPLWLQLFLEEGRQQDEFLIMQLEGTNGHGAG